MRDTEKISSRLQNKLFLLSSNLPNEHELIRIYSSILHYKLSDFDPEEIKPELENIAKFVISTFKNVSEEETLKSTPSQPHYLFSMKDMSRFVQGVALINKMNCDSRPTLMRLLIHETHRVYKDKLIRQEHRQFLDQKLAEEMETIFNVQIDDLQSQENPIIFTHFFDVKKNYGLVVGEDGSHNNWESTLKIYLSEQLDSYNSSNTKQMNIVLFTEAILQLCRINRVLNIPAEHLLLIGEGGTGRNSLTRLSAFINEFRVFEKNRSEDKLAQFRQSIKEIFEKIVFNPSLTYVLLLGDGQVQSEEILEDVNSLLSLGEIPNLFQKKEGRDDFLSIREKLKDQYPNENEEQIQFIFNDLIRRKIHITFVCGNEGEKLRYYTRNFSSFIYNTTQLFFENWPQTALKEVSVRFLSQEMTEEIELLANYFSQVHQKVSQTSTKMYQQIQRKIYVTQKNFVDFNKIFLQLMKEKKMYTEDKIKKYTNGLQRLKESTETVDLLKDEMEIRKLDLNQKKKESEEMFFKIKDEKGKSEKEKKSIEKKEQDLQEEKDRIQKLADEANEQLQRALPALEAANDQVSNLDSQSISQIKTFLKTKDKRLELIMFSIMVLLKEKQDWATVQKVVVDANFLKRLKELDKDKISEERIQKLEKYTQQPEIQGNLSSYSQQVQILKEFVVAVEQYVKINLDVEPIRKRVKKLNSDLEQKSNELLSLKLKYEQQLQELGNLNEKHSSLETEYMMCEEAYQTLEQRLDRSQKLVIGLSSSQESWEQLRENYLKLQEKLLGDVMISASILAYFGPFPYEYREEMMEQCLRPALRKLNVNYSAGYDFVTFMVPETDILGWTFKGLPDDPVSIQNGVIVKKCVNWPLMIDPQAQGLNWLTNLEKDRGLMTLDANETKVQNFLKKALKDGIPLLLRNVGKTLPTEYEPILERNVKQLGPSRFVIYFNEEPQPFNSEFQFYITTRSNNPTFSPEMASNLTIVNFSVKQKGLEEQILGVLLRVFDEKVENQRIECIKTKAKCSKTLEELEDKILMMLQEDRGIMVDDVELIETLEISREKEEEIKQTVEINKANMKKSFNSRENYRYIGRLGSILYFSIQQLEKLEYVYQFPLERYLQLFENTLISLRESKNEMNDSLQEKIKKIDTTFRREIYHLVSTGLFEKDKLLFSLLMAITMAPIDEENQKQNKQQEQTKKTAYYKKMTKKLSGQTEEGDDEDKEKSQQVDYYEQLFEKEYKFFVNEVFSFNSEGQESNPDPSWINDKMWGQINELNKLPTFQGITGSFLHSTREWRSIFNCSKPEQETLPSDWSQKIKGFSLILLIKTIRPDRVTYACRNFIADSLGRVFIEPKSFDIEEIYQQTLSFKHNLPILILMGPNVDPWTYIENLAKKHEQNVIQISLGKGQISKAKEKVFKGLQDGFWVYLGNIHLSFDFMRQLLIILDYFANNKKNPNFQLFLSSKATDSLPLSLLNSSLKVTLEPFRGIKMNMLNIIKNLVPSYEPAQEGESLETFTKYKKIIFCLSWFHSLLNERKRFKSLGWNISYEFSESDFSFAEKVLKNNVQLIEGKKEGLQWENIRNILSRINYGGRVTDSWDQRLIDIYTEEFFTEQVFTNSNFRFDPMDENSPYKMISDNEDAQFNLKGNNLNIFYSQFKDDMSKFVMGFPEQEEPSLFGQHVNADIQMKIQDSKKLISSLQIILLGHSDGDATIYKNIIGILEEIKKLCPSQIQLEPFYQRISKVFKELKAGLIEPMNTVLIQESEKFNTLLALIQSTVTQIERCLKGEILISEEIERTVERLNLNLVPNQWGQFFQSNKTLYPWMHDLKERIDQVNQWIAKGSLPTYWIGGFIYPSGFLTAVLQKEARKQEIPIDDLKFEFSFIENEANINHTLPGIYIKGLYLEGAHWNSIKQVLEDSQPMKLYSQMPIILFKPTEKVTLNQKFGYYECPTYIYSKRAGEDDKQSFLLSVQLPFLEKDYSKSFWAKRGTALLLQTDE